VHKGSAKTKKQAGIAAGWRADFSEFFLKNAVQSLMNIDIQGLAGKVACSK